MPYYLNSPSMNPLSRLLAAIVGALVLVGAFFFGLFIVAAILVVGLVAWAGLWIRGWWLTRNGKVSRDPFSVHSSVFVDGEPQSGQQQSTERGGDVIEAEYTVVSRKDD